MRLNTVRETKQTGGLPGQNRYYGGAWAPNVNDKNQWIRVRQFSHHPKKSLNVFFKHIAELTTFIFRKQICAVLYYRLVFICHHI